MRPLSEFTNRMLCADARRVLPEIPSRSIDLIITDPPYGDNTSYGSSRIRIAGNEHPLAALLVLSEAYRVLKPRSTAYAFCGMRHLDFVRMFFARYTRYRLRDIIIWDKVSMGLGYAFRKQYECILVLEKGTPRYRNHRMLNLLSFRRVKAQHHPHTKPPDLIKALILHSSDPGAIVLDPFAGSGTTALAAKQLQRSYIGIEIDPRYHRLAEERLAQCLRGDFRSA